MLKGQPERLLLLYGADFVDRLQTAGFTTRVVACSDYTDEYAARHVLRPPELSALPLATNYRKVFVGLKTE